MKTRTRRAALVLAMSFLPILMGAMSFGCGPVVSGGGGEPGGAGQDPGQGPEQGQGPGQDPGDGSAPSCGGGLHIFGVYETHSNHSANHHAPGAATVHVERQGSLVLALSSYEPVHWTIIASPGAVIEKVILNGYHQQTAEAPAGVPVEIYDHEDPSSPDWLGAYAYAWPSSEGGSDTPALVGALEQLAGRGLTSFHGCYQATSYVLHDDISATVACTGGQGELTSHVNQPDGGDPPMGPECEGASGTAEYKISDP